MKRTIILIDDEKDFCYFVKKNLEATGEFDVIVKYNGQEGLERIKVLHPDLILLDIMMPGMGGPDVVAELRENETTKGIPIVFLTAIVQEQEAQENKNIIGGWYYLAKPVQINELVDLIKRLTKGKPIYLP